MFGDISTAEMGHLVDEQRPVLRPSHKNHPPRANNLWDAELRVVRFHVVTPIKNYPQCPILYSHKWVCKNHSHYCRFIVGLPHYCR
jgi:hypothetical protein